MPFFNEFVSFLRLENPTCFALNFDIYSVSIFSQNQRETRNMSDLLISDTKNLSFKQILKNEEYCAQKCA